MVIFFYYLPTSVSISVFRAFVKPETITKVKGDLKLIANLVVKIFTGPTFIVD
jgi:hypothetical protein